MNKIYAGVGARNTPENILLEMENIAKMLCNNGWVLRSGGAKGADYSWENGCNIIDPLKKEIFLPEKLDIYSEEILNKAKKIAIKHHGNWSALSKYGRNAMIRNVMIVLGSDLNTPVNFCIYWRDPELKYGGTKHTISVCKTHNIQTIDMYKYNNADLVLSHMTRINLIKKMADNNSHILDKVDEILLTK
jgi:hypothetical protein